jgi:hypothetical protein
MRAAADAVMFAKRGALGSRHVIADLPRILPNLRFGVMPTRGLATSQFRNATDSIRACSG